MRARTTPLLRKFSLAMMEHLEAEYKQAGSQLFYEILTFIKTVVLNNSLDKQRPPLADFSLNQDKNLRSKSRSQKLRQNGSLNKRLWNKQACAKSLSL
jgi:hypothetical protein